MQLTEPMGVGSAGAPVERWSVGGRRARLAFALLVLERRRAVARDELAQALWGDELPRSWEPSLREVLSRLRAALAAAPAPVGTIVSEAGCHRFVGEEGLSIDVEAAARAADVAEAGWASDPAGAAAAAEQAVAIAERQLLPEDSTAWVEERRRRLRETGLRAHEALAAARLALGEHRAAAQAAQAAQALEPLRESAHVLHLRALAEGGDRARAIEVHDAFRRRLLEELGVPPAPETQAAYLRIIEDDRAPSPVAAAPAGRAVRTVLFVDLAGSTELAARVGDRRWGELRRSFVSLLEGVAAEHGLRVVQVVGDGALLATEQPGAAVTAATDLTAVMPAELELELRAGIHTGECELAGDDLVGLAVHVGARIAALARPGEVLVSSTVRELTAGGDTGFEDRGVHALRGVPGTWRLYAPIPRAHDAPGAPQPAGAAATPAPIPRRLAIVPPVAYVGRTSARELAAEAWAAVRSGQRRILLLSGEPGIGKTRLATEVAITAHRDGATVLYGASDAEETGAYGPFTQALDQLIAHAPEELLRAHVARHGAILGRLMPALHARLPDVPAAPPGDPDTERFRLLAATAGLLVESALARPLVVVLDDLHWADRPSLSALRHLVDAAAPAPYLLIATYRHTELERSDALRDLLAELGRAPDLLRIALSGLAYDDVAALVEVAAGQVLDTDGQVLAARLHEHTDGNPFYLTEMLRDLVETGAIRRGADGRWVIVQALADITPPPGVRDVVARRVDQLGERGSRALAAASVIGREFDLELLIAVTGEEEDDLVDLLDAAVAAGVVVEVPGASDRFRFAHALGGQTLYERQSRARRARTHRRVAEAIDAAPGAAQRVGELAHHFLAAPPSERDRARHFARLAGQRALERFAPDEAMRWFGHALELVPAEAPAGERLDALIPLGEAQQRAGDPAYGTTLLEASRLALRQEDADRLAAAVLANGRGRFARAGEVDHDRTSMLEAAIERLGGDDPRRARALALLAGERVWDGDVEARIALTDEALAIARETRDPVALAQVLALRATAIWAPWTLEQRLADGAELEALGAATADPTVRFWAAVWHGLALAQSGDAAGAERRLEAQRELAGICHQPMFDMIRLVQEGWWALARGDVGDAERLAADGLATAVLTGDPDAQANYGTLLVGIRLQQGRMAEMVDALRAGVEGFPGLAILRAQLALAHAHAGDDAAARELLQRESAGDFATVPVEPTTLATFAAWAETAARLGASEHADSLLERLDPYRDQQILQATSSFGCVGRYAALLHAAAGRTDVADERFTATTQRLDAFGARAYAAQARAEHARLLMAHGTAADRTRALALAADAAAVATTHGYAPILELAEQTLTEGNATAVP